MARSQRLIGNLSPVLIDHKSMIVWL